MHWFTIALVKGKTMEVLYLFRPAHAFNNKKPELKPSRAKPNLFTVKGGSGLIKNCTTIQILATTTSVIFFEQIALLLLVTHGG